MAGLDPAIHASAAERVKMGSFDDFAEVTRQAGYEIFWLGPASSAAVSDLESLVEMQLPQPFARFLREYGGGDVVGAEVSGIEANDGKKDGGGTVWGDTKLCRTLYNLPKDLAVIYFHDDEVCWCIDGREPDRNGYPVVSYNIFTGKIDKIIAPDFDSFFRAHLELYGKAS
jgi:antitoxin YobK